MWVNKCSPDKRPTKQPGKYGILWTQEEPLQRKKYITYYDY
jgi:hypothetical protein